MKSIISIANINLSVEVRNDLADIFYAYAVRVIFCQIAPKLYQIAHVY